MTAVADHATVHPQVPIRPLAHQRTFPSMPLTKLPPDRILSVLENTTDGVFLLDPQWRFSFVNAHAKGQLEADHDLIGSDFWTAFPAAQEPAVREQYHRAMDKQESVQFEFHYPPGNKWFEVHAYPWDQGIAVFLRDLPEGHVNDVVDREANKRLQLAVEATGLGVWDIDLANGSINSSNEFRSILGLGPEEPLTLPRLVGLVAEEDKVRFERRFTAALSGASRERLDSTYRLASGPGDRGDRWIRVLGCLLNDGAGRPVRLIGMVQDVTDSKTTEDRIRHAAYHDTLTGLPNRTLFRDQLETMLAEAAAADHRIALLLLDLDAFKDINDSLGQDIGDELLTVVAQRLSAAVGAQGLVSRHGGDEFAVVVPEIGGAAALEEYARDLMASLRVPVVIGDRAVEPRVSVGASIFPIHGTEPKELVKNADVALYTAKSSGRSRYVLFDEAMWQPIITRLEQQLHARQAIVDDRILPFYQPKVELLTGRIAGFEALLRWVHPKNGLRTPEGIFAAFNHPDLANEIGRRMQECVLADLRRWTDSGIVLDHVAINASEPEVRREDFVDGLLARIRNAGLPNRLIQIEITETVFFGRDAEVIANTLRQLKREGVSIALDDFGTGFASLTHLRQHPIQTIKIDQSFTRELGQSPEALAIVRAVINLGRGLGMEVVAEGVATLVQRDVLRKAGCEIGQGFLFGRPMIAHRVPEYVQKAGSEILAGAEPG